MKRLMPILRGIAGLLPRLAWLLPLAGCGAGTTPAVNLAAAASLATVPALGRTAPDAMISLATGRDCSLVRSERGQSYCRRTDPPWEEPPLCTRSLGVVDCWRNPDAFGMKLTGVADGPRQPTAEQEAYRTRSWPLW